MRHEDNHIIRKEGYVYVSQVRNVLMEKVALKTNLERHA